MEAVLLDLCICFMDDTFIQEQNRDLPLSNHMTTMKKIHERKDQEK